ncbi:MAG: tRNA (adenosine(37)-N6)-dimethylallyltransferase MiaA [Rhodospirillaceae bacterium]|nr:tRNA (adenosine(37)-N6)-dimethylallyltransferase MiaA [Rhodospirillaceae bacterium]
MGEKIKPCICITGPTACGKTELALQLAEDFPVEIISMDSVMVYRGMDIGTAKPSSELRSIIKHHLIDIVEPIDAYSAGRFVRDAKESLSSIYSKGRVPLIVGGTLLYLKALRDGLAQLPERDSKIRQKLDQEAEVVGWPEMHRRLQIIDPDSAVRISSADGQRIQRALEVYELTGETLSALHKAQSSIQKTEINTIALVPETREKLSNRIEKRFDVMVSNGFIEEVKALKERGDLSLSTSSMRAVGYRQIWAFLDGEYIWKEARNKAIIATRQLAKRQMTWLRSESKIKKLNGPDPYISEVVKAELNDYFNIV